MPLFQTQNRIIMLDNYKLPFLLLAALLMAIPVTLEGQESLKKFNGKKITRVKNRYENGDKETYYVLQKNKKTLHGPYEVVISCGNGIRGQYEKGKPVGKWTFANHDGIFQEYDFDAEKFLFRDFESAAGEFVRPAEIEKFDTALIEAEPTIIGGRDRLQHLLQYGAVIPEGMTLPRQPSFCTYEIFIDEQGNFHRFEIKDQPAAAFLSISKDAVKTIRGLRYFPMIYKGKPVASAIEVTIYFPSEDFQKEGYAIPDNRVHPLLR